MEGEAGEADGHAAGAVIASSPDMQLLADGYLRAGVNQHLVAMFVLQNEAYKAFCLHIERLLEWCRCRHLSDAVDADLERARERLGAARRSAVIVAAGTVSSSNTAVVAHQRIVLRPYILRSLRRPWPRRKRARTAPDPAYLLSGDLKQDVRVQPGLFYWVCEQTVGWDRPVVTASRHRMLGRDAVYAVMLMMAKQLQVSVVAKQFGVSDGHMSGVISMVVERMFHALAKYGSDIPWQHVRPQYAKFAEVIAARTMEPDARVVAFIDGTNKVTTKAKDSVQAAVMWNHKHKKPAIGYQGIHFPNGLTYYGAPCIGNKNDWNLYDKDGGDELFQEKLCSPDGAIQYALFGDGLYMSSDRLHVLGYLQPGFLGVPADVAAEFNHNMSVARVVVEHSFGRCHNLFPGMENLVSHRFKNGRVLRLWAIAFALCNLIACDEGIAAGVESFGLPPPSLEEFLSYYHDDADE